MHRGSAVKNNGQNRKACENTPETDGSTVHTLLRPDFVFDKDHLRHHKNQSPTLEHTDDHLKRSWAASLPEDLEANKRAQISQDVKDCKKEEQSSTIEIHSVKKMKYGKSNKPTKSVSLLDLSNDNNTGHAPNKFYFAPEKGSSPHETNAQEKCILKKVETKLYKDSDYIRSTKSVANEGTYSLNGRDQTETNISQDLVSSERDFHNNSKLQQEGSLTKVDHTKHGRKVTFHTQIMVNQESSSEMERNCSKEPTSFESYCNVDSEGNLTNKTSNTQMQHKRVHRKASNIRLPRGKDIKTRKHQKTSSSLETNDSITSNPIAKNCHISKKDKPRNEI